MGTRHLYWILSGSSFAVQLLAFPLMLGVPVVAGVSTDAGVSLLLAPSEPLSLLLQCLPIVVASCCCRAAVADILASSGVPAVAFY
jgi:hypothetical protein